MDEGTNDKICLSARNPFKMDEQLFCYDMDTEDEEAEENGEDLKSGFDPEDQDEDEKEHDEDEGEYKGFIVDDDYLSVSEMNYSNISQKDEV